MQSIFRLPWCSDPLATKIPERAPLEKVRPAPVVEIPVWNKLKRKRTNSLGEIPSSKTYPKKKERSDGIITPVTPSEIARSKMEMEQTTAQPRANNQHSITDKDHNQPPALRQDSAQETKRSDSEFSTNAEDLSKSMANNDDVPMSDVQPENDLTRLQQVIENEFNMQILMKHNELRLIEQELAKCQVALEQLRRVELRPFPGGEKPSVDVSAGTGPTVLPPAGYTKPTHPAPYGVTDGPYSRHYSQWLLHDPLFDSSPANAAFYADPMSQAVGRPTRNSGSARKSISKPYLFPARTAEALQSIPNYPTPVAKDKSAPLILKRSTDNQFVKLICNNCLRGNFSSIQGFLNHCRIAHKVDYKSHDAAAIDCGRLLDENEVANLPPEPQNISSHKPSLSRISTAASTPHKNLVHPLNTGASPTFPRGTGQQATTALRNPVPSLASPASSSTDSPFTASSSVPRLSAHFAKHQRGGDLASAVASAKQKVDLGLDEDMSASDVSEQNSPMESALHNRTISGNGRASMMTMPGARPGSNKGIRQVGRQPRPSPLAPVAPASAERRELSEIPESPHYHGLTFSPHTADSNPGLVSDHEDDDHGSASEEEAPHAEIVRPFPVGGTCSDNVEIDVAEDDDMDRSGLIIRRNSMFGDEERGLRAAATPSRKLGLSKRAS